MSATLIGLLLRSIFAPLGDSCLAGAAVLGEALLAGGRLGGRHLSAPWPVPAPGPVALGALAAGLLGVSLLRRHRRARWGARVVTAAAAVVIVAGIPPATGPPERVEVTFLDVGQGDAAVIAARGELGWARWLGLRRRPQRVIVIDAGDHPEQGFDVGAGIVVPAVAAAGARRVDLFVATHGDRDHVGGLAGLARSMSIREIAWPAPYAPGEAVRRLTMPGAATQLRPAAAGDTLAAGPGFLLTALHPPPGYAGSENNGSLVVLLAAGGSRVLFAGDIEGAGEAILCGSERRVTAEVVKVAHHGSSTSSTPGFVAAVGAGHAVVSVGAWNRFGHPDRDVLARWSGAGARVWRTDELGAVQVVLVRGARVSVGSIGACRAR